MIVVSDTTPLSELAKVGQLDLLQQIYGEVIVPEQVYQEVLTGKHPAIEQVRQSDWLRVLAVSDIAKVTNLQQTADLELGECAAMILAEEIGADQILIDDLAARRIATSRKLPVTGTVGVLLLAKDQGLIGSVRIILDAMRANGTRISSTLYNTALKIAQE